jgi:hypothetical protein
VSSGINGGDDWRIRRLDGLAILILATLKMLAKDLLDLSAERIWEVLTKREE